MNLDTVNPLVTEPQPKNRAILITIGVSILLHSVILSLNAATTSQPFKPQKNGIAIPLSVQVIKTKPVIEQIVPAHDSKEAPASEILDNSKALKEVVASSEKSVTHATPKAMDNSPKVETLKPTEPSEPSQQIIEQAPPEPPFTDANVIEDIANLAVNEESNTDTAIESTEAPEAPEAPEAESLSQIEKPGIIKFSLPRFKGSTPVAITPKLAQRKRQFGRVIVRGYVNVLGQLEKTTVYLSSGYEVLDDSALEQASQWHYAPASDGFENTGHWVEIPIEFR